MAHHHFTSVERLEISILRKKGHSLRSIAAAMDRSHTTVSRELRRNNTQGIYDPRKAKWKARIRRRYSKYQGMKVRERPDLQQFIIGNMQAGWTPEEIAGRLKTEEKDLPYISAKGIYKGGVENTIGRIRRYIPKGSNLADYSDRDIAKIEHWLNHTPRKCLNWKTPHEIMVENCLFASPTSPNPSGAFEG